MKPAWKLQAVTWGPPRGPDILKALDFALPSGRLTALLGPNGSGKTCLLNLLSGHRGPRSGTVFCGGVPSSTWRELDWARSVAHLEASREATVRLTVREVLLAAQFSREGRWPRVGAAPSSEALGMLVEWEVLGGRALEVFLEQSFDSLSDGERQLVSLIRVLSQGAPALVLDEPMAYLDVRHRLLVQRTLRRFVDQGLTVILSLHELELDLNWVDDVLVMLEGRLFAAGTAATVLTDQVVEEVWGVRWFGPTGNRRPTLI